MFRMALARLQERIELLENQIKENEIIELHNAQQKLNNDKCKKKNVSEFLSKTQNIFKFWNRVN